MALLAFAVLVAAAAPASAQVGGVVRLDVTIGKSQVLDLKTPFTRVSVTNPAIADVFVVTPTQVLINGKAVGGTSLVVFYPDRTLFFDLAVQTDLALLRERLRQIAPRDQFEVQAAQDAVILSGSASSPQAIQSAAEVATVFAPKGRVLNLLSVTEARSPQILLQVHIGEVLRSALRELGFSFRGLGNTFMGGTWPGVPFVPPLGTLTGLLSAGTNIVQTQTPDFAFDGSSFFVASGNRDYAALVRALAGRDMFRTLAKPNLVTESGKEAKFLSGGEFPYPTAQEDRTITIEWKEFGVGLIFRPMVADGQTINLQIRPQVSSLDFSQGLVSAGFRVPVVRKNETATTINLKDGESFAIAGMINNEVRQQVSKIPLLGDIPILGALFRSTRFQNNETELLFLVTAKLVQPSAPGSPNIPDVTKMLELREEDKNEFTLVPGIPGVGEVVEQPFGKSNLPSK
jgi:pilus assembly protein CpaC